MNLSSLDKEEYQKIKLYTMENNNHNEAPVHIRKFGYSDHDTVMHRHEAMQVNYVSRGSLIHQINDSKFCIVRGDIFVIPPYIPHKLIYEQCQDFEMIELEFFPEFVFGSDRSMGEMKDLSSIFDFAYIEPFLVSECDVKPRLNLTGKKQMQAELLLQSLLTEYTEKEEGYLLAVKAYLLNLLVLVGRCFREDVESSSSIQLFDRHRDYMTRGMKYIDEHFSETITLEDVARVALLSQSYFSYLFKAMIGSTFVEYLNGLRIQKSMDLLKNTNSLVVDICFESGFKNVNHFNRTFKNAVGVSPTQYRKSGREKDIRKSFQ